MLKERLIRVYSSRGILREMCLRQLKTRYAGSRLGIWWAVVTPLLMALSINFVFNSILKIEIENYTLFVLAGMIPWFFFTSALEQATGSFLTNASIIRQGIFPREFVPLSVILANLLNFLIGLLILLPVFVLFKPCLVMLAPGLVPVIFLHLVLIIGIGLIFCVVNVFFRDLGYFLSTAFMVWFWVTPVFYSPEMLPDSLSWIISVNPMSYFVLSYRLILYQGQLPSFTDIFSLFLIAALFFIAGYAFFLKNETALLKRL